MKKSYFIALPALIFIILLGYWVKCQMGINLSELSLSNYIPFKYLKMNEIINSPEPGTLLKDSFESISFPVNWLKLWVREEGRVTKEYNSKGINDSRCLLIKSSSEKEWFYSHNKFVEVRKGDIFRFQVLIKLKGDKISALAGVTSYDKNMNVIKWNYVAEKVDKKDKWIKVEKRFVISDCIDYIRFRLSGVGIGEYRFDNVSFRKEQ